MSKWTKIRDAVETVGSVAGNYYLPGSSLVTDRLVSKGSQEQLGSTLGKIAQIGSGLTGSGFGASTTGIPSAADVGGGWTNTANTIGGTFGAPNLGTGISDTFNSGLKSIGSGISNTASSIGSATGLSDLLSGSGATAADTGSSFANNPLTISSPNASGLTGEFAKGVAGNSPAFSSLASPALSAGIGGGASTYDGLGSLLKGGPSLGTIAAVGGAANSLYANSQAQKDLLKAQSGALNAIQPYQASGAAANSRLSDLLGTSGNSTASGYGSLSQPFTADSLQSDPGYKFQLQQGNQALDRQQAAKGNYFSGNALKAAQDYGQGLADTTLNNAFSRYLAGNQQQYGELAGQAGTGFNAANAAGNIFGNTGTARANADISSANITNQALSSLLNGSGAKRLVGYGTNGQPLYA